KRVVKWKGKKWNTRTVYERVMKSEKPDEVLHHKHFAFETHFCHLGGKWFLAITPTWFFSYDGYRKSFYSADSVKWLKRNENNQHVFDQLRLLTHFLKDTQLQMFGGSRGRDYPFLTFGELINFDSAPFLDDADWKPVTKALDEHDTRQQLLWENDETQLP